MKLNTRKNNLSDSNFTDIFNKDPPQLLSKKINEATNSLNDTLGKIGLLSKNYPSKYLFDKINSKFSTMALESSKVIKINKKLCKFSNSSITHASKFFTAKNNSKHVSVSNSTNVSLEKMKTGRVASNENKYNIDNNINNILLKKKNEVKLPKQSILYISSINKMKEYDHYNKSNQKDIILRKLERELSNNPNIRSKSCNENKDSAELPSLNNSFINVNLTKCLNTPNTPNTSGLNLIKIENSRQNSTRNSINNSKVHISRVTQTFKTPNLSLVNLSKVHFDEDKDNSNNDKDNDNNKDKDNDRHVNKNHHHKSQMLFPKNSYVEKDNKDTSIRKVIYNSVLGNTLPNATFHKTSTSKTTKGELNHFNETNISYVSKTSNLLNTNYYKTQTQNSYENKDNSKVITDCNIYNKDNIENNKENNKDKDINEDNESHTIIFENNENSTVDENKTFLLGLDNEIKTQKKFNKTCKSDIHKFNDKLINIKHKLFSQKEDPTLKEIRKEVLISKDKGYFFIQDETNKAKPKIVASSLDNKFKNLDFLDNINDDIVYRCKNLIIERMRTDKQKLDIREKNLIVSNIITNNKLKKKHDKVIKLLKDADRIKNNCKRKLEDFN